MTIGLHNLKLGKAGRQRRHRVGRGNASGSGTYSGRGLKGQKARSGGRHGLKRRGLSQMLRSKPKLGGFKSLKPKMIDINLSDIETAFGAGEIVDPKRLAAKLDLKTIRPGVKILGGGKVTKKLTVYAHAFSESAKQAILQAGGQVTVVPLAKSKKPAASGNAKTETATSKKTSKKPTKDKASS